MTQRSKSRLLAPLALLCVTGAAAAIVLAGNASEPRSRPSPQQNRSSPATSRSTYVVQDGDTLSSIALRLGVEVTDLQDLNPETDSLTMQPGQRLRLRKRAN